MSEDLREVVMVDAALNSCPFILKIASQYLVSTSMNLYASASHTSWEGELPSWGSEYTKSEHSKNVREYRTDG